jgi:hypothetical protein
MKTHITIIAALLASCISSLSADEKPWTPDMGYNVDRRLSAGGPINSPWDFSKEAERAEYRMLYLLEAHRDAVMLALAFERKVGEGKISQEQIVQLRQVGGNLNEVVQASYAEASPYFTTRKNPTLLLMMLYHFEVYCYGGDSNEGWPVTIKSLQELDPAITAKAKELAKQGIENLHKIKK